MRISDWSSDVCSSDLWQARRIDARRRRRGRNPDADARRHDPVGDPEPLLECPRLSGPAQYRAQGAGGSQPQVAAHGGAVRSEEHTSELQSLMRISYAVFCLKKKKQKKQNKNTLNIMNEKNMYKLIRRQSEK